MARVTKELEIQGKRILVHSEGRAEGPPGFLLRAELEGEVAESTLTIGPQDGPGPAAYGQEHLDRDLNAARKRVAEQVAWRARVRAMAESAS